MSLCLVVFWWNQTSPQHRCWQGLVTEVLPYLAYQWTERSGHPAVAFKQPQALSGALAAPTSHRGSLSCCIKTSPGLFLHISNMINSSPWHSVSQISARMNMTRKWYRVPVCHRAQVTVMGHTWLQPAQLPRNLSGVRLTSKWVIEQLNAFLWWMNKYQ